MIILKERIDKDDLKNIEEVTIKLELIALNAELHADLEQFLLENGSEQSALYGINIYYDTGK